MLKATIKNSGSTEREKYLSKLSEETFFGLWSFPNVYTDEGISKSGSGKELCDLLVVFENKIIIFSDKDIAFKFDIDTEIAWKRWFKRAVLKSSNQLYGAEKWIRELPNRVFLDKRCSHKFPLPLSERDWEIHLVAVTCNTINPAAKYFGGGSSGTFIQIYPYNYKACLDKPFTIGDLFPDKTYVHVLDELSLDLLMEELNTISDFVDYLEGKERSIRSAEIIQAAGEEEVLAFYLMGASQSVPSGEIIHPTGDIEKDGPISLDEGLWSEFVSEEDYFLRKTLFNLSSTWDQLIERFSSHIIDGDVGWHQELGFEYHERAVRYLASENRFSRSLLSKAFDEKFFEVPSDRRSSRLMFSPSKKDRLYIFLFLPRDTGQDYKDYRTERLSYMEAYALVAKYKFPKAEKVVILSTEPKMANGRSEDIFSIDFDQGELSREEKKQAKTLMKEERILEDVWSERKNPIFPTPNKPYREKAAKYGRNEVCPCGSGKKYKKCCMQ